MTFRPSICVLSVFAAYLAIYTVASFAQANSNNSNPNNVAWVNYGNDLGGQHYLAYDEINASNVSKLRPAWIFHTNVVDKHTNFEVQPIEANGTVFISSPYDHVFALNAETGAVEWTYTPSDMPPVAELSVCCGVANRGVALGDNKIFIARLDAHLVALDAQSGKVLWNTKIDPWQQHWTETAAPLFVENEVIIGASGGEFELRGHVDAYDANTGKHLWRFYTVPGPGHTGHDTWAGDSWKTGGATVWSTPVADPKLGLIYFGTGNAAPDMNGSSRSGNNLFASSIVAIDLKTGQYKWHFQEVHHGLWDYDAVQPAMLFTVQHNGSETPAIAQCNKNGYCYILDRRNGKPIYPVKEEKVPSGPAWQHASQTQPIPSIAPLIPHTVEAAPHGMMAAAMYTPPQQKAELIQPGWEAGPEWTPSAYSPRTQYEYVEAGGYQPWLYHADPNEVTDLGSVAWGQEPGVKNYGLLDALDTTTGKLAWQNHTPTKLLSGVLVAGDVVFYGQGIGKFDAVDAKTGKQLWTFQGKEPGVGGADASPAAYVVNGREYIIMAFGGNSHMRHEQEPSGKGDAVIAFALPSPGEHTNIVEAHPGQVNKGYIPDSDMIKPAESAPNDAKVVDISVANLRYSPSQFTVKPGEKVAVHLTVDQVQPAGFAIKLPNGPEALKGPVKPHHSEYFVFTAPEKTGTYQFFSEVGPQRTLGLTGAMTVQNQ